MTEQDAKERWCPMVRVNGSTHFQVSNGGPNFRISAAPENPHCIGSACMMWRMDNRFETQDGVGGVKPKKNWARWRQVDQLDPLIEVEIITGHGYCGLAGKP